MLGGHKSKSMGTLKAGEMRWAIAIENIPGSPRASFRPRQEALTNTGPGLLPTLVRQASFYNGWQSMQKHKIAQHPENKTSKQKENKQTKIHEFSALNGIVINDTCPMPHAHANTHPHKGSGNTAERMQEQARSGMTCCLLDVTWLPHSCIHRSCAYLHKVKPA